MYSSFESMEQKYGVRGRNFASLFKYGHIGRKFSFLVVSTSSQYDTLNPTALRKAKIVFNFGLSECNRVKRK